MIGLLVGTCAEARADAIARAGPVLWRAGGAALYRSEDRGSTWHVVLRVEDEEELEDAGAGCSAVGTDGERRIAALCDGRLFASQDGGLTFAEAAAPAAANAIEWQHGRAVARRAARDRVRKDGDWTCRFDEESAWMSGDGGASWQELPDATAYDLSDVIPDGEGGAFAWTSVGLVHLRPEEAEPPERAAPVWAPRLDVTARYKQFRAFSGSAVLGTLTFPLERTPARGTSSLRTARAQWRGRAARLRVASRHVRTASARLAGGSRRRRLLHADELAAQAAALIEAAP